MRYYKLSLFLALLVGISVIILAQFSIPTLFGADGYLHIRMAEFIRQGGLKYDFHWARYSVFANNFSDKDLFYHLLIIPFTFFKDIFFGAKIAACIFTIFFYLVFFLLLKRYCLSGVRGAFLIIFLFSAPFLQTICRMRPMVFIIALTLLYIHLLIIKKHWAIFIVTLIYTLSHVSSPLLLVFAFLVEGVRFINEKQFIWKSIAAVTLGLIVGFLIHPNFPNNLLVFYLNGILVPIFALKWGLELGAEFFPINTRRFVLEYPFILIGLTTLIALSTSQGNKVKTSTKIWLAIAGFFFVFSFFSQRYIAHSYPFILIALAAYISDWWQSQERFLLLRRSRKARYGAAITAVIALGFFGFNTYQNFRNTAISEVWYNRHYERIAKWMQDNVPEGETIFHTNWSDSQFFIGLNPKNDYFVTLDPIYMYYWSPKKYKLYRDIAFGRAPDPHTSLKKEFDVHYGYAGKNYFSGLITQIKTDRRFEVLAEDNQGLVFRLK